MANINGIDVEKLLNDQRVVDEINRHLWIESERAGRDIGFEEAKVDWVKKFAKAWLAYHMPEPAIKERKIEAVSKIYEAQAQESAAMQSKKRRAKSYI
ncbi:MAG: hypothetical protein IT395_03280 [Candidatus Omnitrophica bacterium]|nr:hypothetical protein [Candidatus Omnitrophota bacterium]